MRQGDWNGDGGWWWVPMALMMILTWGAVIWAVLAFIRRGATPPAPSQQPQPNGSPPSDPRGILEERLARGEIDIEDYRARLDVLTTQRPAS